MLTAKLCLLLILCHTFPVAHSSAPSYRVTRAQMVAWSRVAVCETGSDWTLVGSRYSGALGISDVNWSTYAPRSFPTNAGHATRRQQVYVASVIERGYPVPDQDGCDGAW